MKFIRRNRFKVNKIKLLSIKITDCRRMLTENGEKASRKRRRRGGKKKSHTIHSLNCKSILKAKRKWPVCFIIFYFNMKIFCEVYQTKKYELFLFQFHLKPFLLHCSRKKPYSLHWKWKSKTSNSTIGFIWKLCIELESVQKKNLKQQYDTKWMEVASNIT